MHSRISLKIPSGPAILASTKASLSQSISRPKSPKPNPNKMLQQKSSPHSSAYSRITSCTSLKSLSLPSFLQINSAKQHNRSLVVLNEDAGILHSSDCQTDASSVKTLRDRNHLAKSMQNSSGPQEFMEVVFDPLCNLDQIILIVGKMHLSRRELQSLDPNCEISRNVIDASLRCIKHRNRKFFKSSESRDRVLIINTTFSEHIFSDAEPYLYCQRNPLKYE